MIYTSIFGELTKATQIRIDKASEQKIRLFDQAIYERYLTWDTPQVGLSFEEIIGSYGISIAAATMEANGKAPIIGTEGIETWAKSMLLHALGKEMQAAEFRKVLELLDSKRIDDKTKAQQLIDTMFKNVSFVVNGVKAKLDMMFLGALSNNGVYTFTSDNNPEAGVRSTIDYKMPAENKATVNLSWTDENILTVDCWEDLQTVVDAAEDKVKLSKMLMSRAKLSYILRNKAMKQVIFGTDKKNSPLLVSQLNEFLVENDMPSIEVVRREVRIQDGGGTPVPHTPWNTDMIAFVPDGQLGVIKNAYADSELRPETGISYSNVGRIRVSQWGVGEKEGSNGAEMTRAQVLAMPVFTEINAIYNLNTIKP